MTSWRLEPAKRHRLREIAEGSFGYDEQILPKAGHAIVRFRVVEGRRVIE